MQNFRCVYCKQWFPMQVMRDECEQRHEDEDRRIAREFLEQEAQREEADRAAD